MSKNKSEDCERLLALLREVLETYYEEVNWKERNEKFDDSTSAQDALDEIYQIVDSRSEEEKPMFYIKAGKREFKWYDELWESMMFGSQRDIANVFLADDEGQLMYVYVDRPSETIYYKERGESKSIKMDGLKDKYLQDVGAAVAKWFNKKYYWQTDGYEAELINRDPSSILLDNTLTLKERV